MNSETLANQLMVVSFRRCTIQQSWIPCQRRRYCSAVAKIDNQRVVTHPHRCRSNFNLLGRQRSHAISAIVVLDAGRSTREVFRSQPVNVHKLASIEAAALFAFNRFVPKFCRVGLALDVHMPWFNHQLSAYSLTTSICLSITCPINRSITTGTRPI